MFGFLVAVEILVSILLMVVILMQSSKGGGLAGTFGSSSMGTTFGVRRTADFLSRATTILASVFIGLALIINFFFLPGSADTGESVIQSGTPTQAPAPVPPISQPAATPDNQTPPSGNPQQ
jgi:preprotein translocase subunit SecG